MSHKILVAQGGGPTAVINQSLAGVAHRGEAPFRAASHVYGAQHGRTPATVNDQPRRSRAAPVAADLAAVAATPRALGSTRDKPGLKYLQGDLQGPRGARRMDTFFYIGGNNSSDTGRVVGQKAKKKGIIRVSAIHVPKTINNDLVASTTCRALPSATRFVDAGLRRRQSRQSGAERASIARW